MRRSMCGVLVVCGVLLIAPAAGADVLRVGTYNGIPGQYSSIQDAVDAAQPGRGAGGARGLEDDGLDDTLGRHRHAGRGSHHHA
jgi:hypothetical protein